MTSSPLIINLSRCDIRTVKADMCVSSVHRSKDMSKGRLASDIKAGVGQKVQDELYQVHSGQELAHGEIVLTSPGNLGRNFKQLMFVCLYSWREGNGETLRAAVTRCMEKASEKGHQSIAFPALGMGGQHYPPFDVAKSILTAIIQFSQDHPQSSICTVYIALFDRDINSVRTFLQTSMAILIGFELGKGMNSNEQVILENVDSFRGLQSTKPVQNAKESANQANQGGQVTFQANGINYTKDIGPLRMTLNANAKLSNFTVTGGAQIAVDLSGYVPRPVRFIVQKVCDFLQ